MAHLELLDSSSLFQLFPIINFKLVFDGLQSS